MGPATNSRAGATDEAGRLSASVKAALTAAGVDELSAIKYATLTQEMHRQITGNRELRAALGAAKRGHEAYEMVDGARKVATAARHIQRTTSLGLTSAVAGYRSYGAGGAAGVLSGFVDYFGAYAKKEGIELHACSLAISKVAFNVAAAGGGAVSAVTGWGLVLLGVGIVGTFQAAGEFATACGLD